MTQNDRTPRTEPSTDSRGGDVLTPVPATFAPSRRDDVVELDMEDGLILFDPLSSLVHHLNGTARIVWRLCDGTASVGSLSEEIAEELGLDPIEIGGQVAALVAELDRLNLVADRHARPTDG